MKLTHKLHNIKGTKARQKNEKDKITRPYHGERATITKGVYDDGEKLFIEINRKINLHQILVMKSIQ